MDEKLLNELTGFTHTTSAFATSPANTTVVAPTHNRISMFDNPPTSEHGGIELDNVHRMYPWQENLYNELCAGNDQFVIAGAGGGKTLPIVAYWSNHLLGLNTRLIPGQANRVNLHTLENLVNPQQLNNLPKILWLVPIRALASGIIEDFTKNFAAIIMQYFNMYIQENQSLINPAPANHQVIGQFDPAFIRILTIMSRNNPALQNQLNILITSKEQKVNEYQSIGHQATPNLYQDRSNDLIISIKALDVKIHETIIQIITFYINDQLVGREAGDFRTSHNQRRPFVCAIFQSAPNLVKEINNLRCIVFDESQTLAQADVNNPDSSTTTRNESINKVLGSNRIKDNIDNCRLVILSGTINPKTAQGIMQFYRVNYNRRFPLTRDPNTNQSTPTPFVDDAKNKGNIRVISMNALKSPDEITNLIRRYVNDYDSKGIAFIIFSRYKILDIVSKVLMRAGSSYGSTVRPPLINKTGGKFSRDEIKEFTGRETAQDVGDDQLRAALSMGLGYIFRLDENVGPTEFKKRERDNQIVQNLFLNRKIRVLLATDAIGAGLNLKVTKMFLTSVRKPPKNDLIPLDNLNQLLNRVGREEGNFVVYCPQDDVPYVERALNAKPSDYNYTAPEMPTFGSKVKYYTKFPFTR